MNLTLNVSQELYFSLIRLPRLLMWERPVERFLSLNKIATLYYYLHEYSYGRMITFLFKSIAKKTNIIGFQHGPASLRKMVYMAAKNELSEKADGIQSFPVPDKVLAEDEFSRDIYLQSGYKDVEVMSQVYRLAYLN